MDRTPVVSSNVKSVGYDSDSMVLEVEFKDLAIYHYNGVPEHIYLGLIRAPSKGSYMHQFIKGRFQYRKGY